MSFWNTWVQDIPHPCYGLWLIVFFSTSVPSSVKWEQPRRIPKDIDSSWSVIMNTHQDVFGILQTNSGFFMDHLRMITTAALKHWLGTKPYRRQQSLLMSKQSCTKHVFHTLGQQAQDVRWKRQNYASMGNNTIFVELHYLPCLILGTENLKEKEIKSWY